MQFKKLLEGHNDDVFASFFHTSTFIETTHIYTAELIPQI